MTEVAADAAFMREALAEARNAWGLTAPNPMVGAIVVRDGAIVGRGFHACAGGPHAEPNALHAAGVAARGATLYVNLEPCSTYGRTPPCTEIILRTGVARVVVANLDPNPKHAGRGIEILRRAGIEVVTGVESVAGLELNKAFFHWITTRRPYVLLKMAMTLDGRIATANGISKWITGPIARRRVQSLRQWADAILVSGETVRCDRPQLTVREPADWPKTLVRLIATRTMGEAELGEYFPTGARPERCDIGDWPMFLAGLGARDITALLIEGGGELAAAALRARAVDEVEFHVAPKILGGRNSRPVVGGADPLSLAEAMEFDFIETARLGVDTLLRARPRV